MLVHVLKALVAAVVVGVLPGFFWARCLYGRVEWVERLTVSIGISIVLAPATALLLTRISGTGLSIPLSYAAPMLVFVSGLILWLVLRSSKLEARQLFSTPSQVWSIEYVPVTLAALLGAGVVIGRLPITSPLAYGGLGLLLLAGVAQELGPRLSRGGTTQEGTSAQTAEAGGSYEWLRYPLLALICAVALAYGYSGPVQHDWPYLRGVDQFSHAIMSRLDMTTGTGESFLLYPQGFQYLTALLSRWSGLLPLDLYAALAPVSVVLPALACFAVAQRFWGWRYGLGAAAVAGLLANSPYLYFNDAMYPNLLGAEFLLVLTVGLLAVLVVSPSLPTAFLAALLGSGIVLYHTVSTAYLVLVLIIVGAVVLPVLLWRERNRGLILLMALALTAFISILYAWDAYNLPRVVSALLGRSQNNAVLTAGAKAITTQPPFPLEHTLEGISIPALLLGILGAVLLAIRFRNSSLAQNLVAFILIAWGLMMYFGSRMIQTGFPHRFERDLAMPLAILGGYALARLISSIRLPNPAGALTGVVIGFLVLAQTGSFLEHNSGHSERLLVVPQIGAAGKWLRQHNDGGNIMVSPQFNQVPSRAMLAMGGYDKWQSYSLWQLSQRRDLPPEGEEPLKEVLWVMYHPTDQLTQRILSVRDVRYVVLYKRFPENTTWQVKPEIDWRPFANSPELYKPVFQNDYVLIVKPTA